MAVSKTKKVDEILKSIISNSEDLVILCTNLRKEYDPEDDENLEANEIFEEILKLRDILSKNIVQIKKVL